MRSAVKPVIGITIMQSETQKTQKLDNAYIDAVVEGGGVPVLIPVTEGIDLCQDYSSVIDGLLLSGGQDILPNMYGEESLDGFRLSWEMTPKRDAIEIELTHLALARRMPILGICRGAQLLAVANGGSLYQDINMQISRSILIRHYEINPSWYAGHRVELKPDSLLGDIFQCGSLNTNSFHHQSVKSFPEGFRVTAVTRDGIVEAIEEPSRDFVLGVQWHPELLVKEDKQWVKLFARFCEAAANYRREDKNKI